MFGFKRRAAERESKQAENLAIVQQAVRKKLDAELREIVASLPVVVGLADKATAVHEGFDAVLTKGMNAHGPELADANEPTRAGAMVAQAARNMALLTGTLDDPSTRGDIFYILGFSRDGSHLREDTVNQNVNLGRPASTSAEDTFAWMPHAVSRIIEEDRAKSRAYLAEIQTGRAFVGTPAEKISAAKEFVRNSKVGMAALRVWHATIHYYAWCKREDWPQRNDIGVSEIMEQSDRSLCSTGFRWADHAWMFALEKNGSSYSGDKDLGKFQVSADGELVMELVVAKGYGEFDEWYETDVHALTVGPWADALVEMWAELELAQQRRRVGAESIRLEAQASRINLG